MQINLNAEAKVHKGRFGYHTCSYEDFVQIRDLWKVVHARRQMVAAWLRWARKAPKNRVHKLRNGTARLITPPLLPLFNCKSGFTELDPNTSIPYCWLSGPDGEDLKRLQKAYYIARHPVASESDLVALPVKMSEIRRWSAETIEPPPKAA